MKIIESIVLMLILSLPAAYSQQKPFVFGSIPDPHFGDNAARENFRPDTKKPVLGIFPVMKRAGCELVLIPGDWLGGHWEQKQWVNLYGSEPKARIHNIAGKIYDHLITSVQSNGLEILMCPGDHEYGDNPWPVKSERAYEFPLYREAFAKAFFLDETGKNKFNSLIGSVPQRPVGTQYENSSIAYVKNNVLFISLDLFHFEKADSILSDQGVVAYELADDQAIWLENVLIESAKVPAIQFVVVQAHCPINMPVFYKGSSGLTVINNTKSSLWKLLTKYKVDVYIAGEVHAVTVTKDAKSQTVEFVHGLSTYGIWTATDNKLNIKLYDNNAKALGCLGEMTIDKTGKQKIISATGAMKPIENGDLLVHYALDEMKQNSTHNTGKGYNGQFKANTNRLEIEDGIIGKCGIFKATDSVVVYNDDKESIGFEVIKDITAFPRSVTAWVNTTANEGTIAVFGSSLQAGLNLYLQGGKLNVGSRNKAFVVVKNKIVNDGKWHFIAATYNENVVGKPELKVYIDGIEVEYSIGKEIVSLDYKRSKVVLGANRVETTNFNFYYKTEGQVVPKTITISQLFTGKIDDFGAWKGALSNSQVKALYNAALHPELKYNASQVNDLFRAYSQNQSVELNSGVWKPVSGVKGAPGDIIATKEQLVIILGQNNNGMAISLK
jgi:hypothetical protein